MTKGRPKKDSAGLPDWFDIKKYQPARDFGALQWFEQLVFRERIFAVYEACLKHGVKDFKVLLPAFRMLQDDPVITALRVFNAGERVVDHEEKLDIPDVDNQITLRTSHINADPVIGSIISFFRGAGVTALTAGDLQSLEPKNYGEEGVRTQITFNEDGSLNISEPPLKFRGRPIVAFDLSLKDEILIREMRELLREMRKMTKPVPLAFVKNSDFLKWYNSGVLPYLDLMLWGKIGHDYTWAAFIRELSLILDDPISSESAAMKAAQSYAKKLLDPQTIRTLEAQAYRESSHGAKKSGKLLVT